MLTPDEPLMDTSVGCHRSVRQLIRHRLRCLEFLVHFRIHNRCYWYFTAKSQSWLLFDSQSIDLSLMDYAHALQKTKLKRIDSDCA